MKVAFHTLGCKVNQYETEAMAKMYRQQGYEIVGEREFAGDESEYATMYLNDSECLSAAFYFFEVIDWIMRRSCSVVATSVRRCLPSAAVIFKP